MSSKPELKLAWCSYAAAKYAVEHWHYSRSMPVQPLVTIGVWEDNEFVGCVLFGRGASPYLGKLYGLCNTEIGELVRVALTRHTSSVSRIVAIALRLLHRSSPGLRLVVSFADPKQGHYGGIYQAGGWVYTGTSAAADKFRDRAGRVWHSRQVSTSGVSRQFGELRAAPKIADCTRVKVMGKHRYLMPLDAAMKSQIEPLRQPYPKRAGSVDGDTSAVQAGIGGSTPTSALCATERERDE